MERAELGIDGNCGFARLGENIQEGEAEFEEIICDSPKWTSDYCNAAKRAINIAHRRLKARLAPREFSYYLGESYPD